MTETAEPVAPAPTRRRWPLAAGAVALVAVVTALALTARSDPAPMVRPGEGRRAPTFSAPDVRDPGVTVSLTDFAGKPVVLNWWASWCVPCEREMPAFQAAHEKLGDRVAFVGVNHQDSRRLAVELAEKTGVRYPSAYDPDGKVGQAYGLFGMPTTVFVSADGRIVGTHTGELRRAELEDRIKELFFS